MEFQKLETDVEARAWWSDLEIEVDAPTAHEQLETPLELRADSTNCPPKIPPIISIEVI